MDSLEESLTDNDKVEEVLWRTGGMTAAMDDPHFGFAVFIQADMIHKTIILGEEGREESKLE